MFQVPLISRLMFKVLISSYSDSLQFWGSHYTISMFPFVGISFPLVHNIILRLFMFILLKISVDSKVKFYHICHGKL